MRVKTFAEHRIRAKAAVQYPGWRVDFVGPDTIAPTHVKDRQRVIEVRHRREHRKTIVRVVRRIAKCLSRIYWQVIDGVGQIVMAVIWLLGMWMGAMLVMALAMGVRL